MGFGLPTPPTLAEVQRLIPAVPTVPPGTPRPQWSVMIPTHNCAGYLRRTLASVLAQDPGPGAMQIEVVDDGSTADDPEAVVRELGGGRVAFHRNARNLGATETFNVCLARSRGRWVHLLHGDDFVLPGYYTDVGAIVAAHPDLVMVVGKVVTVDDRDRWLAVIGPDVELAGRPLDDFASAQALRQLVQFAGAIVRRDAYERAGGFCGLFGHVADWDMWLRISLLGPVWCTERPYGVFRMHGASDTNRHVVHATNVHEAYLVTALNLARLAARGTAVHANGWQHELAHRAYRTARKLRARGLADGRRNQARWAARLHPTPKHLVAWLRAEVAARAHSR